MNVALTIKRCKRFLEYLPKIITFRTHRVKGYLFRSGIIKLYLKSHKIHKLHIGAAGNIIEEWLNADLKPRSEKVIFLDVTEAFPMKPCTFDYIFSEHLIEHLPYNAGRFMLKECYRVMKPGGRIRIATPDLVQLTGLLSPKKSELQERYIKWIIDKFLPGLKVYRASIVINNSFCNFGHCFIYDRETLKDILEEAGFIEVISFLSGESNDAHLKGIEFHGLSVGSEEMNRFETMVLEARRP